MTMPRYSIPELRVNKRYADMLIKGSNENTKAGKDAVVFVKKKT